MLNQFRYSVGKFEVSFYSFDLTGPDVESFLQNQSTFNISLLKKNAFHLTSFLDPQGRIECYGWLLHEEGRYTYLVPEKLKDATLERLNRYLISEDVIISEPLWKDWTFILGPDAKEYEKGSAFEGEIFGEVAYLSHEDPWDVQKVHGEDLDLWRGLTGSPDFYGNDFKKELITNINLFEQSVSSNKGCYPGQETVSKIATRRGAAFSPVLIEVTRPYSIGPLLNFEKKIGDVHGVYEWMGKTYLSATLLRDFRVAGMQLSFKINDENEMGIVRYFPLISGSSIEKAQELFYEGSNFFKKDNVESAEESFKLSIKMDPTFADAYESLGVMLGRLERFPEAIEWMQKLTKVDPKSVLAHTNMSLYLMRMGKIEEAEDQKSQATLKSFVKFGEEAKEKTEALERTKEKESEWAKRESMFRQVLEIDADDTLANFGLGTISVEKQDWVTAQAHLEVVLKADPQYSVAYLALGKALKGQKKKEEARSVWQKGITVAASRGDLMPANQMNSEIENL